MEENDLKQENVCCVSLIEDNSITALLEKEKELIHSLMENVIILHKKLSPICKENVTQNKLTDCKCNSKIGGSIAVNLDLLYSLHDFLTTLNGVIDI